VFDDSRSRSLPEGDRPPDVRHLRRARGGSSPRSDPLYGLRNGSGGQMSTQPSEDRKQFVDWGAVLLAYRSFPQARLVQSPTIGGAPPHVQSRIAASLAPSLGSGVPAQVFAPICGSGGSPQSSTPPPGASSGPCPSQSVDNRKPMLP
jgi:hypothetical protein